MSVRGYPPVTFTLQWCYRDALVEAVEVFLIRSDRWCWQRPWSPPSWWLRHCGHALVLPRTTRAGRSLVGHLGDGPLSHRALVGVSVL